MRMQKNTMSEDKRKAKDPSSDGEKASEIKGADAKPEDEIKNAFSDGQDAVPSDPAEQKGSDRQPDNLAGPSMATFALKLIGSTAGSSGASRIADGLKRGLERFEIDEGKSDQTKDESPARFFHLLKKEPVMKDSTTVRRRTIIRAALCAALLFAAYFAWQKYFGPSESELSFEDLRSRIPYKIDRYTTITRADLTDSSIELTITKTKDSFDGLSVDETEQKLKAFSRGAQSMCNNKLFRDVINGGRPLHVLLKIENGRILGRFNVDSCPGGPGA